MSLNPNNDDLHNVREFAKQVDQTLEFSSQNISQANHYVAWLDMMGAGHLMSTSSEKAANALARLHIAVEWARELTNFSGKLLPINDGLFMISSSKISLMKLLQQTMVFLASRFIGTHAESNRFLVRGAIAYGPVVSGEGLVGGFKRKKFRENANFVRQVYFGPPIAQAVQYEKKAPPFGIAIHESARAFAEDGQKAFRTSAWLWWQKNDDGSLPAKSPPLNSLRSVLRSKLKDYFDWMARNLVFLELSDLKVAELKNAAEQYFAAH